MNLHKFIDILDQDVIASKFFKKNGKDIFKNDKFLLILLKNKWNEKQWYKLRTLGWIIDLDRGRKVGKEKTYFDDILPVYCYFADYIRCCCAFFGDKRIPWEEWEDLAREQTDILKILVQKNQLKSFRRTKIYRQFGKKYGDRIDEFERKGYLSDIDFTVPSGV